MTEHRCPLTYEMIPHNVLYSAKGLQKLSPRLLHLAKLPFSPAQLRQQAAQRADKMSIAGVQPKLSAVLDVSKEQFTLVSTGGRYILKPPLDAFPEVPENEDLTMRIAALMNIEVPIHGLLYNSDNTLTYFIKRFDRKGHKTKLCVEDFAQLTLSKRDVKYQSSMEKIVKVIDDFTTFPILEKKKLFQRVLFCYITGNEDMHLKNFSLITRNHKVELAPAYDFLNTTILLGETKEEIALPLRGRKNNLSKNDLLSYFGKSCLQLNDMVINSVLKNFQQHYSAGIALIEHSFLSTAMQSKYKALFNERYKKLL